MNRGVRIDNPVILGAFHSSLRFQFLMVVVLVVLLSLGWNVARSVQFRRGLALASGADGIAADASMVDARVDPEPRARLVLRLLFGALWTIDGLLQLQPAMPLGLPSGVLTPAAGGAPGWVQHVVGFGVRIWSNHPITAATSAVWIQIGIGIALLVAPRGMWSRGAGLATAGWGLVVWVFGEAIGGIFTPGASWLFGLPGAAIFYVAAGLLLALPEARWKTPALGRWTLRAVGGLFVGMGVLQAWPGRGTWTGQATPRSAPGPLTSMVGQMAQVSQPSVLSSLLRSFASFDAAHGWGVNLFVVIFLVVVGACLLTGNRRVAALAVGVGIVVCLADWVLVQDFGFLGGVGTDPNSMIPTVFLLVVGYLALVATSTSTAPMSRRATSANKVTPVRSARPVRSPAYLLQVAAVLCASAIVLLGAAPMAFAAANPNADVILTEALNGTPNQAADFPAWGFSKARAPVAGLSDQHGRSISLAQFRGRVVVLTFLDPVCTTDCPLIAQQLSNADHELGAAASRVVLVAIDANPTYLTRSALDAFDRQERLTSLSNWEYVTGPRGELNALWTDYGVNVAASVGGAMSAHSDVIYVLDTSGQVRSVIQAEPGGTAATWSSLSSIVVDEVQRVLAL